MSGGERKFSGGKWVMRILLVCTGNTCRSPMAEALLRRELATRGLDQVVVSSAGVGAWDGAPASEGSYLVALEHGLDLSSHRARQLTPELVGEADLILPMGRSHLGRIAELGGAGKTQLLGEFAGRSGDDVEVSDPYGGDIAGYRDTYDELVDLVARVADRLAAQSAGDHR